MKIIFKKAFHCHICKKKYKEGEEVARDHCLITGKYRGSAHYTSNLKYKISVENLRIPVVFYNLKGYDGHLIIREIGEIIREENKKIEEKNKENIQPYEKTKRMYKNSTFRY